MNSVLLQKVVFVITNLLAKQLNLGDFIHQFGVQAV